MTGNQGAWAVETATKEEIEATALKEANVQLQIEAETVAGREAARAAAQEAAARAAQEADRVVALQEEAVAQEPVAGVVEEDNSNQDNIFILKIIRY